MVSSGVQNDEGYNYADDDPDYQSGHFVPVRRKIYTFPVQSTKKILN